jgi:hypothetical protein
VLSLSILSGYIEYIYIHHSTRFKYSFLPEFVSILSLMESHLRNIEKAGINITKRHSFMLVITHRSGLIPKKLFYLTRNNGLLIEYHTCPSDSVNKDIITRLEFPKDSLLCRFAKRSLNEPLPTYLENNGGNYYTHFFIQNAHKQFTSYIPECLGCDLAPTYVIRVIPRWWGKYDFDCFYYEG